MGKKINLRFSARAQKCVVGLFWLASRIFKVMGRFLKAGARWLIFLTPIVFAGAMGLGLTGPGVCADWGWAQSAWLKEWHLGWVGGATQWLSETSRFIAQSSLGLERWKDWFCAGRGLAPFAVNVWWIMASMGLLAGGLIALIFVGASIAGAGAGGEWVARKSAQGLDGAKRKSKALDEFVALEKEIHGKSGSEQRKIKAKRL